jgi:hypothetical protein
MARKAFLISANTLGLKYSVSDAASFAACLRDQYGYSVAIASSRIGEILESYFHFLDDCASADTAIIYLSGHARLDRGGLMFVLHDQAEQRAHLLDVNHLVDDLGRCQARDRLLVLDCCFAARATVDWTVRPDERYLQLVSSSSLDPSKEFDWLGGSLMTTLLVKFLRQPDDAFVGDDGHLGIQEVFRGLEARYDELRRQHPEESFPAPCLIGNHSNRILMTLALHTSGRWTLPELRAECAGRMAPTEFELAYQDLRRTQQAAEMYDVVYIMPAGLARLRQMHLV